MEVEELYEGVLVGLNDTNVLESDESNEKTDTCGNCLFETIGKSLSDILSCAGKRQNKEDNTRKEYYAKSLVEKAYFGAVRRNEIISRLVEYSAGNDK